MKAILITLGVVVLGVLAIGGWLMGVRNDLVPQREAITAQWSQVDTVLQRRADLIPNLVETVKGYAKQETQIFTDIASARASMGGARTPGERISANGQLDSALARLLVVVENYPQLKSNENFLRLHDEIAGAENRIAVERHKYNEAVLKYNTAIELFPANVVAGMFGFTRNDAYFKVDPAKREAPAVKF
ncbi:MAG: LemA family protein [Acidobacteria bacterium]|nr:LemA family protein [Acidobacteriota bacterium]